MPLCRLWRSIPAVGGQDPSFHAEVSADIQAHPAHGVSGQCSVQYRLTSPRADDGGSRKSSMSQL